MKLIPQAQQRQAQAPGVGGIIVHPGLGTVMIGGERPEAFRFTCTTPPGSGLMIDDMRLTRATPMRVEKVTSEQSVAPVLVSPYCAILCLHFQDYEQSFFVAVLQAL